MPFCSKCGRPVEGQFCSDCGQPVVAAAPAGEAPLPSAAPAATAMADNVAGLLCYPLGFITGVIFLALAPYNQSKFVRFHAFQSIFLSVAWLGVWIIERFIDHVLLLISWHLVAAIDLLWALVGLAFLLLVVLLMVKAYQNQRWKLPVIGDFAEKQA